MILLKPLVRDCYKSKFYLDRFRILMLIKTTWSVFRDFFNPVWVIIYVDKNKPVIIVFLFQFSYISFHSSLVNFN